MKSWARAHCTDARAEAGVESAEGGNSGGGRGGERMHARLRCVLHCTVRCCSLVGRPLGGRLLGCCIHAGRDHLTLGRRDDGQSERRGNKELASSNRRTNTVSTTDTNDDERQHDGAGGGGEHGRPELREQRKSKPQPRSKSSDVAVLLRTCPLTPLCFSVFIFLSVPSP